MDNPENLATQGIQVEEKQNTICVGHQYEQTNTNSVRHDPSYKQQEEKTGQTNTNSVIKT